QVSIGLGAAAPYTPTQLIELRQAERIGPVHDDRVGAGHVDARLNDGRSDQHVRLAMKTLETECCERFVIHLPIRHADPRFRSNLLQPSARAFHGLHPVMNKVHLAAATELAENGLTTEP